MSAKPVEIYQGSDWFTYRWTVAQAFDTLDRMRDLCLQMPVPTGEDAPSVSQSRFMPDEEITDIFGYIVELCDDLGGEMDTVYADLSPQMQTNMTHCWAAFEMRLHLKNLRDFAYKEAEATVPAHAPPDTITSLVTRIKTLLKQLDQ